MGYKEVIIAFGKRAKEAGWTEEEIVKTIKSVNEEVKTKLCRGQFVWLTDILREHVYKRKLSHDAKEVNENK